MFDDEFIRVARRERFAILDQETVRDKRLSFGARGLLNYLLSLPDNWHVNTKHLLGQSPAKDTALRRMVGELKKYRYMARLKFKDEAGRFKWKTIVAERPLTDEQMAFYQKPGQLSLLELSPVVDFPRVEEPQVANPRVELPREGNPQNGSSTSGKPTDIRKTDLKELSKEEKLKNEEMKLLPFSSPEFLAAWDDYVKVRREKRKPITKTVLQRLVKKMIAWGEAATTAALNYSADRGYTGVDPSWGNSDLREVLPARSVQSKRLRLGKNEQAAA